MRLDAEDDGSLEYARRRVVELVQLGRMIEQFTDNTPVNFLPNGKPEADNLKAYRRYRDAAREVTDRTMRRHGWRWPNS